MLTLACRGRQLSDCVATTVHGLANRFDNLGLVAGKLTLRWANYRSSSMVIDL